MDLEGRRGQAMATAEAQEGNNLERVLGVISANLGISLDDLSEDSDTDSVPGWDSLRHMSLVLALEDEFDVAFADADVVTKLLTVRGIIEAVNQLKQGC